MSRQKTYGDKGYAMKRWLDLTQPMPVTTLTIDHIKASFHQVYKEIYGKPVPLGLGLMIERQVAEMKADYSKQTRFRFMKKLAS
jgi:hypothetical protein